ncbi:MAG: hypothetical protein ACRDKW_13545 [Actinomycetota bacterium]
MIRPPDAERLALALRRAAVEADRDVTDPRDPEAHVLEGMARAFRIAATMVEDEDFWDWHLAGQMVTAQIHAEGALRHLSDTGAQSVPVARSHIRAVRELLRETLLYGSGAPRSWHQHVGSGLNEPIT